jgi:hypothetical protein
MSLSRQGSTPGSERTSGLLADPSAGISPPPPVATSPGTRKSQRPPRSRARGPSQRCPASGKDLPRSDALYPAPSNYTTNRATRRTTTARTAESTPLRSNTQTAVPHTPTPSPTQIKAFYIRSTPACHLSPPSDAEPIETRPCPLRGHPEWPPHTSFPPPFKVILAPYPSCPGTCPGASGERESTDSQRRRPVLSGVAIHPDPV